MRVQPRPAAANIAATSPSASSHRQAGRGPQRPALQACPPRALEAVHHGWVGGGGQRRTKRLQQAAQRGVVRRGCPRATFSYALAQLRQQQVGQVVSHPRGHQRVGGHQHLAQPEVGGTRHPLLLPAHGWVGGKAAEVVGGNQQAVHNHALNQTPGLPLLPASPHCPVTSPRLTSRAPAAGAAARQRTCGRA